MHTKNTIFINWFYQMNIVLISGGGRSGKSKKALSLAKNHSAPYYYIATCPYFGDAEMETRISKHKHERALSGSWITIEEELAVEKMFRESGVYVLDCLTLWLNNLLYHKKIREESDVSVYCEKLFEATSKISGELFIVTNEVGCGIIPDNEASRVYRDIVGRANQIIAEKAKSVIFMSCGLPLVIKGSI